MLKSPGNSVAIPGPAHTATGVGRLMEKGIEGGGVPEVINRGSGGGVPTLSWLWIA